MTAQATRDALAEMDGWKYAPAQVDGLGANAHYWWRWTISSEHGGRTYASTHPHPPTLDGADAAVPEGYEWERTPFEWLAWKHGSRVDGPAAKVDDTGDKIADLSALGLACRRAMEHKA